MDQRCAAWTLATNRALAGAGLPLRVVRLGTVWTMLFTEPGRYNWLLQYYLRAEGVTLSWVGTGRCLSSMDFSDGGLRGAAGQGPRRRPPDEGGWLVAERTGTPREGAEHAQGSGPRDAREPDSGSATDSRVLCGDHAAQEGRPSRLAQQRRQPALPHRQLERVSRVLRARVLGPHDGDVGRASPRCSFDRSAMPCSSRRVTTRRPCSSATTRATRP